MPATPPTGGFRLMAAPLQGYTEAPFRHFHAEIYGGGESLTYFSPFLRIEKGSVRPRDLRDITSPLNANHRLIPQIIFRDATEFRTLTSPSPSKCASASPTLTNGKASCRPSASCP